MEYAITLHVDVGDEETLADLVSILESMVPYIADNVVVTSQPVERSEA